MFSAKLDSRIEYYNQEIALSSLCLAAKLHQINAEPYSLAHSLGRKGRDKISVDELIKAAKVLGLEAKLFNTNIDRLHLLSTPALLLMDNISWVVMGQCDEHRILVQSPGNIESPLPEILPKSNFQDRWSNHAILLRERKKSQINLSDFSIKWFIVPIKRYKKIFIEILAISFFLQIISLITPLFFQVITDKVLSHNSVNSLDVLILALISAAIFESILSAIRNYLFANTTNKIDLELGRKLFSHILSLPITYFERRNVGDISAKTQELERLREFLTSNSLTLILDILFSIIFLSVMLFYSVILTVVVILSLPIYFIVSLIIIPILKDRLQTKFIKNSEIQSLLIESLTGIRTIKTSSLEPILQRRWEMKQSEYVAASVNVTTIANTAHELVNIIGKISTAIILWLGSHLVMDGTLTLGMFIAFNMLAQRVAQPIMRMAQMWSDFQQAGISINKLAEILTVRSERSNKKSLDIKSVRGDIKFANVMFKYEPDGVHVLRDLSLFISAGEVIGVVGKSGSGKSTLTKLIQRLHIADAGKILIDDVDINLLDINQFRRHIGVVLQENFLFNDSILKNISGLSEIVSLERVIYASKMAGAHDFIVGMPEGYETILGEQGVGLSGGQKQRIAIARALYNDPRILIFDEATSALDYESESAIQNNMRDIARGRTVIIIAHRLSAVKDADRIIVLDEGRVSECGSHHDLIRKKEGIYYRLWNMQLGNINSDLTRFV